MITIPDDSPQPTPAAGLPANTDPQSIGANIGGALETGAEIQQKVYHDAMDQANEAVVMQGHNQIMQWEQDTLRDPKTGLLHQNTGTDAPGAVDKTLQSYDDQVAQISKDMTPAQQALFQSTVDKHRFDVQDSLDKYELDQVTDAHNQTVTQNVQLAHQGAVLSSDDPEKIQGYIDQTKAAIADQGRWNQLSPEAVQMQQDREVASIHFDVMKQMLAEGKDQQAQAWYDQNKTGFGVNLTQATALLDKGSTEGQAQRYVDANILNKDGQFISKDEALTKTMNDPALLDNPKLRSAVEERFNHQFAEKEAATVQAQRSTMDGLLKDADGATPTSQDDPAFQQKLGTLTYDQQALVRAKMAKMPIDIDPSAAYQLERQMTSDNPDERAAAFGKDLSQIGTPGMPNFSKLEARQMEGRKGGTLKSAPEIQSRNEQIDQKVGTPDVGMNTKPDVNGKYDADFLQFNQRLAQEEATYQANHKGAKMGWQERNDAMDRLLVQKAVSQPAPWYDQVMHPLNSLSGVTTMQDVMTPAYKIPDPAVQASSALQIPADDANRYSSEFQAAGMPAPTSGQLADLHTLDANGARKPAVVSKEAMDRYTAVLKNKADPNFQAVIARLKMMAAGQDPDTPGIIDPNMRMQAKQIYGVLGVPLK